MSQSALFQAQPRVFVDDDEGGIRDWPGFVMPTVRSTGSSPFAMRSTGNPSAGRCTTGVVEVPRLLGAFALDGRDWMPQALRDAAAAVSQGLGVAFTHVGLNCYRDGRDSVAPHNDKRHSIVPAHPIALLSLGSPRRMVIRAKQPVHGKAKRRSWRLELDPGSVLLMSYESQKHFDHGIPKVAAPVGPRISLAFRVRTARWATVASAGPVRVRWGHDRNHP